MLIWCLLDIFNVDNFGTYFIFSQVERLKKSKKIDQPKIDSAEAELYGVSMHKYGTRSHNRGVIRPRILFSFI